MERQAVAKWDELAPIIQGLMDRVGTGDGFEVPPESGLGADDQAAQPYQVSHAVRHCISVAADHLHAVKTLRIDAGVLHTFAPATLCRSAIETSATAYWMLGPADREERVLRTLRWHAKNAKDQRNAAPDQDLRPLDERLERISAPADRLGLDRGEALKGYTMTGVLTETGQLLERTEILFAWQMCSGFTHGRPWASLGALERELSPTADEGVMNARLTNSDAVAIYPALVAVHLLEDVLRTWNQHTSQ